MKVAVYYPWIHVHGGIERSLLELTTRSRHQWTIFTGHYDAAGTFAGFRRQRVIPLGRLSVNRGMGHVLGAATRILTQKVPLDGQDAFVVWCDGLGDLATFRNRRLPTFNICSTPLRAVFDPVYARHARAQRGPLGRVAYGLFETAFRKVDQKAWRNYDGVIATSSEVRRRIVEGGLYHDGPRMRLSYPGIDLRASEGETTFEPMLLAPGRILWTKNLELVIDAFLRAELPAPWELVIAGYVHAKAAAYLRTLEARAAGHPRIRFVRSPDDETLRALYRSASAVLFPPLNEDWGIVPLEAMAHGKPVIASASGGPLESVVHGETGWLLGPAVDDWATVLGQIPKDADRLRQMGRRARQHVAKYDWSHFVGGVDDALEEWTTSSAKGR